MLETKGAPEAVLPYRISELREGAAVPLTADRRRQILAASTALADGALRVLSLVPVTIIEVVKYFFTPAP
ncbi:MAG: hypothetical protein NTW36_05095 [Planctomycetia bacterium]|nr:hypothetical protein [Planctomycetia bacterium]